MIAAAIDIGTNTILMTVKNLKTGQILGDFHHMARLGENLHHTGLIGAPAIDRLLPILKEYKSTGSKLGVEKFNLIATSAMRDAKNRQQVIEIVRAETGFVIEVVSGDREAELTFFGGLDGITPATAQTALIDIGGGSTEFILGSRTAIGLKKSLNIGTVRLSERFNLLQDDPAKFRIPDFISHVQGELATLPFQETPDTSWVAVAGTPTSLSALLNGLKTYSPETVHGSVLPLSYVTEKRIEFQSIRPELIRERYPILGKRYDLMLAGCLILETAMKHFQTRSLLVSDRGLRYGALLSDQVF
ncbi:MAG: hypothetical protein L6Q77_05955 [Bacteroidetes bacterium]|nr:hypothetical protein [Bacteroidota bacterium]